MITYKIDKQAHAKINNQIRDMKPVLAEIVPTLQMLQELLKEHEGAISSPSINNYRAELQESLRKTIAFADDIAEPTQKLIAVSEQAAKHLAAIEEHFGGVLREKSTSEPTTKVIE